jgi:hypothetical protein
LRSLTDTARRVEEMIYKTSSFAKELLATVLAIHCCFVAGDTAAGQTI